MSEDELREKLTLAIREYEDAYEGLTPTRSLVRFFVFGAMFGFVITSIFLWSF